MLTLKYTSIQLLSYFEVFVYVIISNEVQVLYEKIHNTVRALLSPVFEAKI